MTDFVIKNERRREARGAKPKGSYTKARAARRLYATGGAFGRYAQDSREWQLCAHGRASSVEADT